MPKNFLEKQSVSLTLLSPIHIGCGEDYEPTNFVADEKKLLLYYFDPSTVPLTDGERKRLGELARGNRFESSISFTIRIFSSIVHMLQILFALIEVRRRKSKS